MDLLDQHHGHAVDDRAVGLADRRTPSQHQLFRAGRPGRHVARIHGSRTGQDRGRKSAHDHITRFGPRRTRVWSWFVRSAPVQRNEAILFPSAFPKDLPPDRLHGTDTHICAGAFNDNLVLPYEGLRADSLSNGQRELLTKLLDAYVGNLRDGHSQIKMDEVFRHIDDAAVCLDRRDRRRDIFYYRIHSPVILLEFDHHPGYGFVQ